MPQQEIFSYYVLNNRTEWIGFISANNQINNPEINSTDSQWTQEHVQPVRCESPQVEGIHVGGHGEEEGGKYFIERRSAVKIVVLLIYLLLRFIYFLSSLLSHSIILVSFNMCVESVE